MSEKVKRRIIPLSAEEQRLHRPLPIGVLLGGIDTPIQTNNEPAVSVRVRRTALEQSP